MGCVQENSNVYSCTQSHLCCAKYINKCVLVYFHMFIIRFNKDEYNVDIHSGCLQGYILV